MFAPLDIGIVMGLILVWIVLSLTIAFRMLNFPDLTIEGSFILGAAVFGTLIRTEVPIPIAILIALFVSSLAGAFTAFIHIKFKLNKFLAGIITISICYSLSLRIMSASNIGLLQFPSIFQISTGIDNYFNNEIHVGTILLLVIVLLISSLLIILFLNSYAGLKMRATGSNNEYAKSLGLNTTMNLIFGLSITNMLAGLSGIFLVSYQGFVDINLSQGFLIIALASMTIGEKILPSARISMSKFVVLSAIAGSIIYQLIVSFAIAIGLSPTDLKLITAVLVLVVIGLRFYEDGELFSEEFK
jgi:putative ABC transport system permease protein